MTNELWQRARLNLCPSSLRYSFWQRTCFLAVLVLYLLGRQASIAAAQTWTNIGPGNDYVKILKIDPVTPSTLYAGLVWEGGNYPAGGVHKSIDGGHTWSATGTGMPTNPDIYALAIDPLTPSTLWAGTYTGGVYKSVDGGGTWNNTMSPPLSYYYVLCLAIDPKTPSTVYVGKYGGLYKTINGGGTWNPASTGMPANSTIVAIAIDPNTPSTLYAGLYGIGVYKSSDGGGHWSAASTGIPGAVSITAIAINPATPSTLYAATDVISGTTDGRVFVSSDSGNTWSSTSTGLPVNICGLHDLQIDPVTPGILYAAVFNCGVYKSTDSGGTWSAINAGLGDKSDHTIAIPPTSPANPYVGTCNSGVFVFSPGGPNITNLSPSSAPAGGAGFTLTVNGSNFINGATVQWGATTLPTTFLSVTQVRASVPASLIASVGTASVTVTTPVGTSVAATFTINLGKTARGQLTSD